MSIITPEALARCADEAARKDHLNALRAIELARASKRINDHYDRMILGEPVDRLGRHIFDRRNADHSWSGQATRFIQRPVGDMRDVDLHLSAE